MQICRDLYQYGREVWCFLVNLSQQYQRAYVHFLRRQYIRRVLLHLVQYFRQNKSFVLPQDRIVVRVLILEQTAQVLNTQALSYPY